MSHVYMYFTVCMRGFYFCTVLLLDKMRWPETSFYAETLILRKKMSLCASNSLLFEFSQLLLFVTDGDVSLDVRIFRCPYL